MVREELAPHVRDITRALGDKLSEQEIEKELSSYLNVYRVSLDTAKRSIVKKHGGNPANLAIGVSRTIRELVPGEQSVNLLVRVVSVNEKEVTPEGQPTKTILYGILGDPTATVPFTAWEALPVDLARGDVIRVQNAYTKEYRGQVQVNFGTRTVVAKDRPDALPEYKAEPGARAYVGKPTESDIANLRGGASNLAVSARILSIESREVEVDGAKKTVFGGILADPTGKTRFTAWKDFGLKEDEVVRIEGLYVRPWRGIPEISFDERSTVVRLKDDSLPSLAELSESPRVWIEDLAERGGGVDVTVRGILIDLREGSGLVSRCPECRRVLRKGACRIHGEVKGEADLRVKAVLDDGSGALTAVFDRVLTEALLDKTIEAAIAQAKEAMSADVVRDELADILVAQPIEARGNVTSDDYGLMMIVKEAKILKVDVQQEARAMLEELEGSA
jgi:replication factor A1